MLRTFVFVRTSAPIFSNCLCALAESSGDKFARMRGPASIKITRACVGSIRRKSAFNTCRASSANAPASSTPVGPPPTTTIVINRSCSSTAASVSAFSNASSTRFLIWMASSSDFNPGANCSHSGCPK